MIFIIVRCLEMDIRELGRLDLNLLVALEALIEEGSVSKAAERLFITQSAMSKTLGRLRELFDDPLFIRRGSGMVPTPRAAHSHDHRCRSAADGIIPGCSGDLGGIQTLRCQRRKTAGGDTR